VSPVGPKIPQQGDAARIEQLASGLKKEHGAYGDLVQRTPAGRPEGTTGIPAPRSSQEFVVPDEHKSLGDDLADKTAAVQFWELWMQRFPGPKAEFNLAQAEADRQDAEEAYYSGTPNFET